jgi:hypothetical protein
MPGLLAAVGQDLPFVEAGRGDEAAPLAERLGEGGLVGGRLGAGVDGGLRDLRRSTFDLRRQWTKPPRALRRQMGDLAHSDRGWQTSCEWRAGVPV